jgi:hypothetical protein
MNDSNIERLHIDLDRLGEWAVEYATNINPSKSKARVKDHLNYFGGMKEFPKRAAANM